MFFIIPFLTKQVLHAILDYRYGLSIFDHSLWNKLRYLSFYDEEVPPESQRLKKWCDMMQGIWPWSLAFFLVVAIIRGLLKDNAFT